jgi:hypothetical protein
MVIQSDLPARARACVGMVLRGRYPLDRLLGVGGMACVCAATHLRYGDRVVMAPLSADPRRTTRSMSDVLLRLVVRPTRGMHDFGHDKHGVSHYLAFAVKLGGVGLLQLALRYACAVCELFRRRREQLSSAGQDAASGARSPDHHSRAGDARRRRPSERTRRTSGSPGDSQHRPGSCERPARPVRRRVVIDAVTPTEDGQRRITERRAERRTHSSPGRLQTNRLLRRRAPP